MDNPKCIDCGAETVTCHAHHVGFYYFCPQCSSIAPCDKFEKSQQCSACKQPYHQSTGHRFSDEMRLCGSCAIDFKIWMKGRMGMMNAKLRNKATGEKLKESFGDAAAKSIGAERDGK